MAGPKIWNESVIAQRLHEGRGRGEREHYTPWLRVQEFSSRGTQSRIPSLKLHRAVHTFSYLERRMFMWQEFESGFVDYREQFPLDRSITQAAAKRLGIAHPRYPRTRVAVVMTTDALVTSRLSADTFTVVAWDAKPERLLADRRTCEKLALHSEYCRELGIEHRLFTENTLDSNVSHNIEWLRSSMPRPCDADAASLMRWQCILASDIAACTGRPSIDEFVNDFDLRRSAPPGTGLRVFRMLAWQKRIDLDITAPFPLREQLPNVVPSAAVFRTAGQSWKTAA